MNGRVASPVNLARLEILHCAWEDCYWVFEPVGNIEESYRSLSRAEVLQLMKVELSNLARQGLIRVHRSPQCTGERRMPPSSDFTPDEIVTLPEYVFEAGEWMGDPWWESPDGACICGTDSTRGAYSALYRRVHGLKDDAK
jgi:hypothetical protein